MTTRVGGVTVAVHEPPAGAHHGPLLLTHGAGGDLDAAGLPDLAAALAARGHLTVRVNMPYRESGRRSPPRAERSVVPFATVVDEVRAVLAPDQRWIVGGRSYGGRVASMAVAGGLLDAAGLLLLAYPLHPPGRPEQLRVDHWPDVTVPVLVVQGTRDPFCDVALLEAHVARFGGATTVHLVEGGDHGLLPRGTRRATAVAEVADAVAGWAPQAML